MEKNAIKKLLTENFFSDDFVNKLTNKMFKEADVWFNHFNPPFTQKERINQFLGQSAFIRFGDTLEFILNKIIMENGYTQLERKINSEDYPGKKNKMLDYDVIISKNGKAFVAEMKIRDNHDSTKKTGQAEDLERKIKEAERKYPQFEFTGVAFYIDGSLKKNGESVVELINSRNTFDVQLAYGIQLFELLEIPDVQWENFESAIKEWFEENQPMMNEYAKKISENAKIIKGKILAKFAANKISDTLKENLISVIDDFEKSYSKEVQ